MKYFFLFFFFLGMLTPSSGKGCQVHSSETSCNYFSRCHWTGNACVLGPRNLNTASDYYFLQGRTLVPVMHYSLNKARRNPRD